MIRVDRSRIPAPEVLSAPDGKGARERAKAVAFFADPANAQKKYDDFDAYKDPEVKAALRQLFGKKCAYCESDYTLVHPMDVEHWRPKGMVVEDDGSRLRPGYYWLAAEWENLLPSCIDCNRKRKQHVAPSHEIQSLGKANHFPVDSQRTPPLAPGSEETEQPVLLNPCEDEPADYLRFEQGAIVQPVADAGQDPSSHRRAQRSIEIYGLNRVGLVDKRQELRVRVEHRLAGIAHAVAVLDAEGTTEQLRVFAETQYVRERRELETYREESAPYSGMVRQMTDRFIAELDA